MRFRFIVFLSVSAVAGALLPATAAAAESSSTRLLRSGAAWGSTVTTGGTVVSGRSAYSRLGCGGTFDSNRVASVDTKGLRTGAVTTRTEALQLNGDPASRSTTVINSLNVLDGRITAEAVKAVSTTLRDGSNFRSNGAGSGFLNLKIDGRSINASPGQRVNLPGVGYVLLNRRVEQDGGRAHTTRMVQVHVTEDVAGPNLPAGTTIVVGHARSALRRVGGILNGVAFGSQGAASSGDSLAAGAGPSARIYMPCAGTNDQIRRNQIATVQVPSLFTLSNVVSTARGDVSGTSASGRMTNRVEQAGVLDGLVEASGVRAVASGSAESGVRKFSSGGSSFAALSVRGFPGVNANVAPNTRRHIEGLGTLWLRRVIRLEGSIEVRMIELQVTEANSRGLPVGAVIRVGVARAGIR